LLEDEHFSGTARNELTEPDEGVSVESQSIKDLYGIRLLACVAWEEQEVTGTNLHVAACWRVAVDVVDFRRIRWLGKKTSNLQPNSFVRRTTRYYPKRDFASRELSSHMEV